jgi:hypothetical protein
MEEADESNVQGGQINEAYLGSKKGTFCLLRGRGLLVGGLSVLQQHQQFLQCKHQRQR